MFRPAAQEPVKTIVWMRGSATSALPASSPPGSRFSASCGTPPACSASTTALAHAGACSAGLSTTALPVASAAPTMPAAIASGKFHGAITPVTPRGDVAHRVALARAAAAAGGRRRARARPRRSTRGSRSPRRRRRRPRPTACRPRGRPARRARGGASAGCSAARESAAARSAAGLRDQTALAELGARDRRRARAAAVAAWAWATIARRVARVHRREAVARDDVLADQHRHLERELGVERGEGGERLAADGLAAQLEQRFVGEGGHGASRSSAVSMPLACAARKESLAVFSSRRRTR